MDDHQHQQDHGADAMPSPKPVFAGQVDKIIVIHRAWSFESAGLQATDQHFQRPDSLEGGFQLLLSGTR